MSELNSLKKRINRIGESVAPRPTVIDVTRAKEELIATLEATMTEEERNTPYELTPEEIAEMDALDAFLEEDIKRIERECNIRLVSHA
jgi:hypothetical protein